MKRRTCFVIIGFGQKTDHATGRKLDLDKTYSNIIKPVFDELGIDCFRAKEIVHSGIIDVPMYEWIYKADIVVADLSTSNANALYELGVRHALRPHTTIVMGETKLAYPFDLSHTVIEPYEHLESGIDYDEVLRFREVLKTKVISILDDPKTDSPIYTFMHKLQPPRFTDEDLKEIEKQQEEIESLSVIVEQAEKAKDRNDFATSKALYNTALRLNPNSEFLQQRLALATYKAQTPDIFTALKYAEEILNKLRPNETTDPETLGLMGAVYKRYFELSGAPEDLEKAIWYYEKGFYIRNDYYNGINVAHLLTLRASLNSSFIPAIADFYRAQKIWEHIIQTCINIIENPNFQDRDDKEWVLQTLAQAHLGLDNIENVESLIPEIQKQSKGDFDLDTFYTHNNKLVSSLRLFHDKFGNILQQNL